MKEFIAYFYWEMPFLEVFLYSLMYFAVIYFPASSLFYVILKFGSKRKWFQKISEKKLTENQIRFELLHSSKSILLFALSTLLLVVLIRQHILPVYTLFKLNFIWSVILLLIWNEIHFFLIHKLMHTRFLLRKVHCIHHRSNPPTPFSIYSFHSIEAILLSTVPHTLILFVNLDLFAIAIFPMLSAMLNYFGHSNHQLNIKWLPKWSRNHLLHHKKSNVNFGFGIPLFDYLIKKLNN